MSVTTRDYDANSGVPTPASALPACEERERAPAPAPSGMADEPEPEGEPEPEPEVEAPLPEIVAMFAPADPEGDGLGFSSTELKHKLEADLELLELLEDVGKDMSKIFGFLEAIEPNSIQDYVDFDTFQGMLLQSDFVPEVILDPPFDRDVAKDYRIRDFVAQTVTYNTNDSKEKNCLEYVEKWNRQFTQLFPERRPLLLCPFNECGIRKFICTTLRPTKLPYNAIYEYPGTVKFVYEYCVYETLENVKELPSHAPSPHSIFNWQRGDSLDYAVALCSLLLGVGYDAYVVSGYAPEWITHGRQSHLSMPGPQGLASEADDDAAREAAAKRERGRFKKNNYEIIVPAALESGYEAGQAAKAKTAAEAAAADAARVPPDPEPVDGIFGQRVHFWVLLRVGKRMVTENLFCDAVTGRIYPVTDSPYLGVESIFNDTNYFVNMQQDDLPTAKLNWRLSNPVLWEFVFFEDSQSDAAAVMDLNESDALGMETEAPESVRPGTGDAGDEGLEHLEVPPSWSRRIDIPRDRFDNRALGGEKGMQYKFNSVEIFAAHHRPDGCVEIVTSSDDQEVMQARSSTFSHRIDKLTERLEYGPSGKTHEKFAPGHREQTGQSTYSSAPTGRITGLKDIVVDATHREFHFYNSARLDGLAKRIELFGVKVAEDFVGRDDHLVFRSIVFDTEGLTDQDLMEAADKSLMEQKIRKMTEKYERNPDVPAAEDVYKKTYYYRDGKIKLEYHHAPGRITRQTRLFSKEEERRVDALEKDPVKTVRYDENVVPQLKAPKVLWENEKDCLVAMKDAELEARTLIGARSKDESTAEKLEEALGDRIRKTIAAGGADLDNDDKKDLIEERDYLKPYLGEDYQPHDMTVRLSKEEAIRVKDECLKNLKDSLIERANIIQSRLDDENAVLARRQAAFQRNREHQSQEAEEEYEDFCAEAWFRIQILEQRLSRHEDAALQKFAELDTTLRNDPRLSCLHEY